MKTMLFRYNDKLEADIETVQSIHSYPKSKNLTVVHAVQIAAAYIKKIQKQKSIKEKCEAKDKVEDNLGIVLSYMNDLQNPVSY